ncbi:MAG: hypothetical protein HZA46_08790 [Planctomycetales bacterium]|nr:hypothetical protein [Planctomycetales bacterium]
MSAIDTLDPSVVPPATAATREAASHEDRVLIRPYPKIIVYYPTLVAALVCGLVANLFSEKLAVVELVGTVFIIVLFWNTVILAFEFPRLTAITVILLMVSLVLAAVLLNRYLDIVPFLSVLLASVHLQANDQFYLFIAGIFLFVFAISWVLTRFDYWEVLNNELLHHHGPFGDLERFPAPQLKLDKEIPDIFEYLVLRSGRLIFYPTSERRAIVLDNVMGVNRVEAKIKHLLEALEVRIDPDR